jgi:hypothetical protein
MYFNRFDIVEAHYCFYSDYHEGLSSDKYARLCRIGKYFRPRPSLSYETLEENARYIYDELVAKESQAQ